MTKARLYLDFDGVVNALSRNKGMRVGSTGWDDWISKHIRPLYASGRYLVNVATGLVDEINDLSDMGVDVVWLSSWNSDTQVFSDKLGFHEFRYVQTGPLGVMESTFEEWKLDPLLEDVYDYPVDTVAWAEDNLDEMNGFEAGKGTFATVNTERFIPNIYALRTDPRYGITRNAMKCLRRHLLGDSIE